MSWKSGIPISFSHFSVCFLLVNGGVHTNGSQFYITTHASPHLDGYSVAFGRVVEGMDVIDEIAGLFSIRGRTVSPVVIESAKLE